ncbi:MAG TPA: zf-HC2 domain-containing protein [Planctomycetota bacterium]|nr:zf-HC2 domain-containing protein [Planctomycetota bacterium]
MNCSKCGKMLALYAGGDLEAERVREVEGHLHACEACRRELEGLRSVIGLLQGVAVREEELPESDPMYRVEIDGRLRERALDAEHLSSSGSWWLRTSKVLAQAAVVLLTAAAVVYFATSGQEAPAPPGGSPVLSYEPPPTRTSSKAPVIVLIHPPGSRSRGEFTTVAAEDEDVDFSDFGTIRRPGELRRLHDAIVPAVAEEQEPF